MTLFLLIPTHFLFFFSVYVKNVDAGAAKELMAYLVKLQSNLDEVNKYVYVS